MGITEKFDCKEKSEKAQILDYHIHSNYSNDAVDSMEDIIVYAIDKGISEIVFTDHIEFFTYVYADIEPVLRRQYPDFLRLKEKYRDSINIKFGVEVAQQLVNINETKAVCDLLPFDFILFSLHRALGGEDYYDMNFNKVDVDYECKKYINEIETIVDTFDCFSVLGHLDFPARYIRNAGIKCNFDKYKYSFEPIFEKLIKKGKGIEVNTSGLRTPFEYTMPSKEILELYYEIGGEILTIGADSHQKEYVGANFCKTIELIKQIGFTKIAKFDKMNVEFLKI